jgi:1-acyl-sn-glycerol-3-phosphate acyltransferase
MVVEVGEGPAVGAGPLRQRLEANLTGNFLALLARFLSGASVRWIDSQPDTCQRVYFANHTSHLDAVVIWSALPQAVRGLTRPVAAKDYWTGGPIRRYLSSRVFNALLIDRTEIKVHRSPVDMMVREIGNQFSLIVFPEGGRNTGVNPDVGEFKSRSEEHTSELQSLS